MTEQRYQAVLDVIAEGRAVMEVASQWSVSRRTVHRWLARYEAAGLEGLPDRSHRPERCPHQMPAAIEVMVLELRRAHRYWGARRLALELVRKQVTQHAEVPEINILSPEERDTLGDGRRLVNGAHWHTDDSFKAVPCSLTMLYGVEIPPVDLMNVMSPVPNGHETASKTILNGVVIPANGTIQSDLKTVLDTIFNHPNVGPFVCRQLIERLVTSNPGPGYLYRVVSVFNDNGQGVRGDLKAVVRQIEKNQSTVQDPRKIANENFNASDQSKPNEEAKPITEAQRSGAATKNHLAANERE